MQNEALAGSLHGEVKKTSLWKLSLAALGVVYGDIGTSPLYAIKESFNPAGGIGISTENVMGVLSLVFWALTLVVSIKYLAFVFRADNRGEGGIMALLGVLLPAPKESEKKLKKILIVLALIGAGLLYGDGVITPAISVLSAIEGLKEATPAFEPYVVPLTVAILVLLFAVQKSGTAKIGTIFGPIMVVWFLAIGLVGIPQILQKPEIVEAVNPVHALRFFAANGLAGFVILSAVVLCITGTEALYADMGHFGKGPIKAGWYAIVFPSLLVNYFGQGAIILNQGPTALSHPFYALVSGSKLMYPMVALATVATVIASQALISGAFSLSRQAVQLGYLPRLTIRHTSASTSGQIFVPKVNLILAIACIFLVIEFRESSNLAAAYGIAVTTTMLITSILFFFVTTRLWNWSLPKALLLLVAFMAVDFSFFLANTVKIIHGGWIPILICVILYYVMSTWRRGRDYLAEIAALNAVHYEVFFHELERFPIIRVKGTAVFMNLSRSIAPLPLIHHVRHSKILHETVLLITVTTVRQPYVPEAERIEITNLGNGFVEIIARYGYMQSPDIAKVLELAQESGLKFDSEHISYFLGREVLLTKGSSGMRALSKRLFVLMSRNARSAAEYFNLPPGNVIEIGVQLNI